MFPSLLIVNLSHDANQSDAVYNRSENVSRCHISESEPRCDASFAIVGRELRAGTCFPPPRVTFLPLPSDSGFHGETLSVSCRICYFGRSVAVHWSAECRVHSALHSASRRSKGSYSGLCCCSGSGSGSGSRSSSDDDDDSDAAVRSSCTRNATWLHLAGGRNRKKSRTASNRRHVALKTTVPSHTCRSPCQDRTPPPPVSTGSRSVWMDLLQRERHKGGTLVVVVDGKFFLVEWRKVFSAAAASRHRFSQFIFRILTFLQTAAPVRLPGNYRELCDYKVT